MRFDWINKKWMVFFSIMLCFFTGSAQKPGAEKVQPAGSLSEGTIESQFNYLLGVSNNFQDFKVIKKTSLDKFKSNVFDSLNVSKKQLIAANSQLSAQKVQIDSLKSGRQHVEDELKAAKDSKESFSVLGLSVNKGVYSGIMWGIVLVLAAFLLFFIYRYRQSHIVTIDTRKALDEVQRDFDVHRKKAMEREQKLNRQLVDEMNKRQG